MLKKHPSLRFICLHLASLECSLDDVTKRLDRFPNMLLDAAKCIYYLQYQSMTDYRKLRLFIKVSGSDHLTNGCN